MRRIISTLCSSAFFLASTPSSVVEGRMGGNTGSGNSSGY